MVDATLAWLLGLANGTLTFYSLGVTLGTTRFKIQQRKQCTFNAALGRVRVTIAPVEKQ
jgi:hypothetical protein